VSVQVVAGKEKVATLIAERVRASELRERPLLESPQGH
jgi:hypothetical protein